MVMVCVLFNVDVNVMMKTLIHVTNYVPVVIENMADTVHLIAANWFNVEILFFVKQNILNGYCIVIIICV